MQPVNIIKMENKNLTAEEQLAIIESTLKHSSNQKTGASNYYIIWGTTLSLVFMLQFLNASFPSSTTATLAKYSGSLYALGGLLSFLQSRKDAKKETIVPINEKIYAFSWIGASIGIAVISIGLGQLDNFMQLFCVAILLIFGLINFVIGGVTKFKPLLVGGLLSMVLVILIPLSAIENQWLITSIGVMVSCLIPGLMMKFTKANV